VSAGTGFKSFERLSRFALLTADFQVGDELSAKQEIKRHVIADRYRETITALFS
jgi:long-chain acyl-CoA synthetase